MPNPLDFSAGGPRKTLRARAAWAHDYNPDRAITALFQPVQHELRGQRTCSDPDAALPSAGAEVKWLNGFSIAEACEGEFSGNTASYAQRRRSWLVE